ncbi:MAG: hypothetical protein FD166_1376 [Bacteroidetes bacterium]|nr:MAG: hypothetical protein FD166_1376 [Bacteroidota bacterium]
MNIELKELFERTLREGVNLFLGSGFSIFAKDSGGVDLPTSNTLCNELATKFNSYNLDDLTKVCTIIDSYDSEGLRKFLLNRFNVKEFPDFYKNIVEINCPRIFTTNIDNLLSKVFDSVSKKYLNNIFLNGLGYQDSNCIDYIPLHGSIEVEGSRFLFNMQDVSSSFSSQRNGWANLSISANQIPSLFIGYSLSDVGAVQALFGDSKFIVNQKNKWIVLLKSDPGSEAYFRALGFKIIIADIQELLEYFGTIEISSNQTKDKSKDSLEELYPDACVPKGTKNISIRSIDEFFLGASPIWSDIISNRIYKVSHHDIIVNLIEKQKNIVITGIPASGKSTLLLQIAKHISSYRRAFVFNKILTLNKTNIIKNEIKSPTVVFVDNFTNDIDAFVNLACNKFIKLVGFDRYYNVDINVHKLPKNLFEFYDATDLVPQDIQGIYDKIPQTLRKTPMTTQNIPSDIPSVFEIVNYNINRTEITNRYKPVIKDLKEKDPILSEMLILSCYMHACRTPVSFEVANSYLFEDVDSYDEVLELLESLRGLVNEVVGNIVDEEQDQDYYQPRSQILAETIISQASNADFGVVYEKFHMNVPQHVIPNYHVFKRFAYDSFYAVKAFPKWEEGLEFYDSVFVRDRTPFILQQAALYLLRMKKYQEAAIKIDLALQISKKRFFSIENTHAIILFKANINSTSSETDVRSILDRSMQILKSCYLDDQRKTYHAITFAEQAIEYYTRFTDSTAQEYLELSKTWLREIGVERKYDIRARRLLKEIEKIL